MDAGFIWTEPHSMRLKVKLTVQGEVLNGAILQQVRAQRAGQGAQRSGEGGPAPGSHESGVRAGVMRGFAGGGAPPAGLLPWLEVARRQGSADPLALPPLLRLQSFVVEFVVERHMCPQCNRANANPNSWVACVQARTGGAEVPLFAGCMHPRIGCGCSHAG